MLWIHWSLSSSTRRGIEDGASEGSKTARLVAAGKLGKKSGEGLYRWNKGRAVKNKAGAKSADLDPLATRLMKPLLDECRRCLDEGIVEDPDLLDAGVIFGTGFAPFRGGPLFYLEQKKGYMKEQGNE